MADLLGMAGATGVDVKSPLFEAVQACAVVLLGGVVLPANDVTAGNGVVIDWREVKHGETLQNDGDAFDTAYLFVTVTGVEAAHAAAEAVPK